MATKLHFVLFEHASGYSLFRIKEFDEIVRTFSAHANAFLKPVAFVRFQSVAEAVENIQSLSEGLVTDLLRHFLRSNITPECSILGVSEESLGKAILECGFGFECIWHGAVREILRIVRQNYSRLMKSLVATPGQVTNSLTLKALPITGEEQIRTGRIAESKTRVIVGLARARIQLNLHQHLADSAVVRGLTLVDDLDKNFKRSVARLRTSYSLHFPEVCQPTFTGCPYLLDSDLVTLIAVCPSRVELIKKKSELEERLSKPDLASSIANIAQNSIGYNLAQEDAGSLKAFASTLLGMISMRQRYVDILTRRIRSLAPNLYALLDSTLPSADAQEVSQSDEVSPTLVAARLIANAGSLSRLARMPSSRVLSLGASKSVFRKSGAVAATSTGLIGSTTKSNLISASDEDHGKILSVAEMKALSGSRLKPDTVRRKTARLLAAKSTLACRADCFQKHNPLANEVPSNSQGDPQLASGTFGEELGREVTHQLHVWSEANGVHLNRTKAQADLQRLRRKKYRKQKRKAWLSRKLSRATAPPRTEQLNLTNVSVPIQSRLSVTGKMDVDDASLHADQDVRMEDVSQLESTITRHSLSVRANRRLVTTG